MQDYKNVRVIEEPAPMSKILWSVLIVVSFVVSIIFVLSN